MEKMTNLKALTYVKGLDLPTDVSEKIDKMIASLEKKNGSERKPTETQIENKGFKKLILEFMEYGKQYSVTDIQKGIPELVELSNQRVSALVRQLKEDKDVVREEIKGKAYFTKA